MKTIKSLFLAFAFIAIGLSSQSVSAKEVLIQKHELPKTAQKFISDYFGDKQISYILKDKEMWSTDYKVKFVGNLEIEFDSKGNWEEVDGNREALPMGILPAKISNYVQENFQGVGITQVERGSSTIEVELSNGLELEFNKRGDFIRIDD